MTGGAQSWTTTLAAYFWWRQSRDARLVESTIANHPIRSASNLAAPGSEHEILGGQAFDLIMADLGLPDSRAGHLSPPDRVRPHHPPHHPLRAERPPGGPGSLRRGPDYLGKKRDGPASLGLSVRYALVRLALPTGAQAAREVLQVFRHSRVGVISTLEDGIYQEVNDAFLHAVGYSREEVVGQSSVDLGIWLSPEDRQRMVALIQARGSVSNLEVTRRTKDGRTIPTLYSGELLEIEGRQCLVSVSQDISAIKVAEAERLKIEQQLLQVQKLESLGVLAGGIAHDFNNMLMGILGNAELARMDLSPESPVEIYLDHIETTAKRLADLTNQLLAYSGGAASWSRR